MSRTATLVRQPEPENQSREAATPSPADRDEPLTEQKFNAMWEMAQLPAPVNDDEFTPKLATEIIMLTRDVLKTALYEIYRLHNNPSLITADNVQEMHAELTRRFAERKEAGFTARQFEGDGGMWTIFAANEQAIAFAPDRDSAIQLVHMLAAQTPPKPDPGDEGGSEGLEPERAPEDEDDPDEPMEEGEEDDDEGSELTDPDEEDQELPLDTPAPAGV